ncbi:hypothetical protein MRX96_038652 [Rhipicephalus microplus]
MLSSRSHDLEEIYSFPILFPLQLEPRAEAGVPDCCVIGRFFRISVRYQELISELQVEQSLFISTAVTTWLLARCRACLTADWIVTSAPSLSRTRRLRHSVAAVMPLAHFRSFAERSVQISSTALPLPPSRFPWKVSCLRRNVFIPLHVHARRIFFLTSRNNARSHQPLAFVPRKRRRVRALVSSVTLSRCWEEKEKKPSVQIRPRGRSGLTRQAAAVHVPAIGAQPAG